MHRIEPHTVYMEIAHPHQSVVAEEAPHLVRPLTFKIHSSAPRRVMSVDEIRAKFACVISHGAKVVVHHVDQHRQSLLMGSIYESLEAVGATVPLLHRKECDAVVSPAVMAGERCHRHQLNMRYAKINQMIELANGGIECALRRKGPNMQFVDDAACQRWCTELRVSPRKCLLIIDARRTVYAIRLPKRPRVRIGRVIPVD